MAQEEDAVVGGYCYHDYLFSQQLPAPNVMETYWQRGKYYLWIRSYMCEIW